MAAPSFFVLEANEAFEDLVSAPAPQGRLGDGWLSVGCGLWDEQQQVVFVLGDRHQQLQHLQQHQDQEEQEQQPWPRILGITLVNHGIQRG